VPWDADLAKHLDRVGIAVPEERVAAGLLDEVAQTLSEASRNVKHGR
jgi:hypothetical protein